MAPSSRSGPAAGLPGRCCDGGTLGSTDPHVYRPSLVLLQCLLLELYLKFKQNKKSVRSEHSICFGRLTAALYLELQYLQAGVSMFIKRPNCSSERNFSDEGINVRGKKPQLVLLLLACFTYNTDYFLLIQIYSQIGEGQVQGFSWKNANSHDNVLILKATN